jgi:hypothetical protein
MPLLLKAVNRYMPFMSRLTLIIFLSLATLYSKGQQYSFKATSPVVEETMQKAVVNAENFIVHTIPHDVYKKHFKLITSLSAVKSEYASYHYTPYMNDTISFIPGRYELRYLIRVGKDTLTDSFVIPVDSVGRVDVDTSNFHYILDDLKAYRKLLTGQYKFDFNSVKLFIKEKHLKDYSIVFMNSMSTLNSKNYKALKTFKHYWYVTEYKKGGYRKTYKIDPDTGKVTIKSEKVRAVA